MAPAACTAAKITTPMKPSVTPIATWMAAAPTSEAASSGTAWASSRGPTASVMAAAMPTFTRAGTVLVPNGGDTTTQAIDRTSASR